MQLASRWVWTTIIGVTVFALSVAGIAWGDRPLARAKPTAFTADGEILRGTYVIGDRDAGILLLEGFGSDQVTMRSAASTFARAGYHVYTFDFSGHGRSPGGLTFDNAATDRLAHQVLAAQSALESRAGLPTDRILVLGHSMGARVGLQAAAMTDTPPAGLILLGAQVNLDTNVQSEVFTGVADTGLAWVQALGPTTPATNVLLIVGSWDDILTPANADLLLEKLVGAPTAAHTVHGELGAGTGRQLIILERLLHNYEIFSPRALALAQGWAADVLGLAPANAGLDRAQSGRVALWITGLTGIFVAVIGGNRWAQARLPVTETRAHRITVTCVRRYLVGKLLLWLAALPAIALLFGLFYFLPLATPVFNLIYVGFIGGYGLLMLLLYGIRKVPGTEGKLPFRDPISERARDPRGIAAALGITATFLAAVTLYARTGWFLAPPSGQRLIWVALFTPVTALGFWIGLHEGEVLSTTELDRRWPRAANTLLGLVPFFLWTILQAAIGSLSGMVSGVQGLIILALVTAYGALVLRLAQRPWLTAILQAIVLYWLILPQGVLFI